MSDENRPTADEESLPTADDELLSAFLDGALPPEREQALRRRLECEPALVHRLGRMRRADEALRDAYGGIAREPLPERLLAILDRENGGGNVVALPWRRTPRWSVPPLPTALAASVALLAGLAIGLLMLPRHDAPSPLAFVPPGGTVEASSPLHEVLRALPSGAARELEGGVTAMPRLTFRTGEGAHCRQVDLHGSGAAVEILACLREEGWRLELLGFGRAPPSSGGDLFRPAGGPASESMDHAIDALIDGAPLGADAENALIAGGWEEPTP